MRPVLRLISNRYGAAVVLLVVIAVVVGFGRLVSGARSDGGNTARGGLATSTISAPATSGSPQPDDGDVDVSPASPAAPSLSPGAASPESVATDFAKAWLNHRGISAADWHKDIVKYATKSLADRLDGVDPESVPADRMTAAASVADNQGGYVEVRVPTDQGMLILRVVATSGRWLVDGVDWEKS